VPAPAINRTIEVDEPPEAAADSYRARFTPWFGKGKWYEQQQAVGTVTYSRDHFHTWQILVSVLLFPIGLLSLLVEQEHFNLSASFSESGKTGTTIRLSGVIPGKVEGQWQQQVDEFEVEHGSGEQSR